MNAQSSKRTVDETFSDADEEQMNTLQCKHLTTASYAMSISNTRSSLEDLCSEIFLQIFEYLHPVDLLCSLTYLFPRLDTLIKPYTHTLDIRLMNKPSFQYLTQLLFPYFIDDLRVLRLSDTYTFGQIREMFHKLNWSQLNQIESLTLDSIQCEELLKYFLDIHPLLKHLWRLSLTFDENDKLAEKLLVDQILIPTNPSLTSCFIVGITFDLNPLLKSKVNQNLRELTITLDTINDLIILFHHVPNLEMLICTILHSTYNESTDEISSLQFLTILNLTINIDEPVAFKHLQKILVPHTKIKQLSIKTMLYHEMEIGGLVLEKFFRIFSQLTELKFYLRHLNAPITMPRPEDLYLFSFTSHFWTDRSFKVFTHFIPSARERFIYTVPFPFDRLDIVDDIDLFFQNSSPYYYVHVRHLSLSPTTVIHANVSSTIISKYFPNIQTITFSDRFTVNKSFKDLMDRQWILRRSESNASTTEVLPCVYIHNSQKSKHWYFNTLLVNSEDQRIFANASRRIRQLTIYEMTEQQTVALTYFFPWINVLILHVNTLEWISSSNNWLRHLLINMTSLFSLTIYYPKNIKDQNIRDLFIKILLDVKQHFFFKCDDGVVNMWF